MNQGRAFGTDVEQNRPVNFAAMELRALGPTSVRVSALCLGAMTFGAEADETTSRAIIDRYLDAGGNFIDTADV